MRYAFLVLMGLCAAGLAGVVWRTGRDMPVASAGHAAGAAGDRILAAGGTTWQEGTKRWLREAWAYDPKADRWSEVGALPEAVGGGVAAGDGSSLYVLGGSDGQTASAKCYRLSLPRGRLRMETLPSLPQPCVYGAGGRVGRRLYVVGGRSDPNRLDSALATLFCLDLDRLQAGWQTLPPLPGPARSSHAAAADDEALYVFGGCDADEKGAVRNLADAYRYLPAERRWERLPDLPRANRALTAACPAAGRVLIFGGFTATEEECAGKGDDFGFTADVLRYDARRRAYETVASLPRATAAASPVCLGRDLFLLGGEPVKRQRGAWVWVTAP